MPKFKIGDKVVCIVKNNWVPVGTVGIVAEDSTVPFVDWENGDRWCLTQDSMKLVDGDKAQPFKVGDRVRLISNEYADSWQLFEGATGTVVASRHNGNSSTVHFDDWHHGHDGDVGIRDHSCLFVGNHDLKPIKIEKGNIVLFRQGNTVIAKLTDGKKVLYTAEAKCSPGDNFDFFVGSQIALQRLMRKYRGDFAEYVVPEDAKLSDLFVY